jgi:nucleoside-diphosphate-sugar epimerase
MAARRILVTGASGFIGRPACRALAAAGEDIRAVTSTDADLRDPARAEALVREVAPTHVLHLAWIADPDRFWTDVENLAWVRGTTGLLEGCLKVGARFAGAGSCAELLEPVSRYGAAKAAVHALLRGAGLSWAWGRVFHLYGPNEHPKKVVASVIRALLRGDEAPCTSGEQIRDFLHVDDVAAALVAGLLADVDGAFDIGAGEAVPLRHVLETAARAAGRPDLLRLGALPQRADDPPRLVPDVTRLRALGFRSRFDLETGMADAVAWWRTHGR